MKIVQNFLLLASFYFLFLVNLTKNLKNQPSSSGKNFLHTINNQDSWLEMLIYILESPLSPDSVLFNRKQYFETEIYVLVHCVSVTFFIELVCHLKARYTYCVVEARSAIKVILHKSHGELSIINYQKKLYETKLQSC